MNRSRSASVRAGVAADDEVNAGESFRRSQRRVFPPFRVGEMTGQDGPSPFVFLDLPSGREPSPDKAQVARADTREQAPEGQFSSSPTGREPGGSRTF